MYNGWCVEIILIASLFLNTCALSQNTQNSTNSEIQWRIIYVIPEDGNLLVDCPVDYCYPLQDVFNNSSYFFDSYTTLELLPGMYDITEEVGQLVLVNVKNFTLRGSSRNVTIITCKSGATWGLTFIDSYQIEISNIQISHCSAKLQLEESNCPSLQLTNYYNKQLGKYLRYNLSSCDADTDNFPACYAFFASFKSEKITIYETAILHSKGVGIFSLNDRYRHIFRLDYKHYSIGIFNTHLAYNQINCIAFILDSRNTGFYISQSRIEFGQLKSYTEGFKFAAGLNLFMRVYGKTHYIHLINVTLMNNGGSYGNFQMEVSAVSMFYDRENIHVDIQITNMTSIQTRPGYAYGLVVKYTIQLSNYRYDSSSFSGLPSYRLCTSNSQLDADCHQQLKYINIVLQNCHFIESCVTIIDSDLVLYTVVRDIQITRLSMQFSFAMKNITIDGSRCPTALSIINSDLSSNVQLSDLTIINSHNNILSVKLDSEDSILIITGCTSFLSNQGSVLLLSGTIKFKHFILISGNTAREHESTFQVSDSSRVYFEGETVFVNNTGRQGGAISAYSSYLYFNGSVSFIGNSADSGGAISLKEGAVINLVDTYMIFQANTAERYGGAIYVEDAGFWVRRRIKCFVHIYHFNGTGGYVEFENNTARIAGAALFGGWIDLCVTENNKKPSSLFNFKEDNSVASNPTGVYMCTNSTINRYQTEAHIALFPGQTFEIEVVAVGQRFGIIPASIRAETARNNVIDQLQNVQDTTNHCTKLQFTLQSSNKNETIELSIDGQTMPQWINESIPDEFLQFKILITLKDCPLGFEFDRRQNICSCNPYLDAYGVQCNYSTFKVNRKARQWIGVLNPAKAIIIHQHCPHDYCKPYAFPFNLSTPDEQCSSNRSGILCGACQPGLSQTLGTSNCKKCSNIWLLLVFAFALAGVLLVAGLMVLNITVSMGAINGLIFYANIVRANTATFFPDKAGSSFLSWFIAWLNLNIGIETCFYNGLDAYVKTWLQFIFPLYIWFLVILIIISSKYSKRAASLFGVNAVQVLATLFLLSYAKLLRVTITVFQSTRLLDHNVWHWHYDGNIVYLGKQHILLMLVALLLFVLFLLPYTLVLFGIQWLQIFSHYKPFHWVNKLKPLFDAYTGPYKDKHHYWTGLLLLVRISLFIVFSTNTSGDPAINLLAIIIVIICLFVYLAILFGGVYKIWLLNILEYSSLLNLVILSVAMLYTTSANKQNHILSQVSVSITVCTVMLIVAYQSLAVILKAIKIDPKDTAIWRNNRKDNQLPETADEEMQQHDAMLNPSVTHSIIELKEPLIEY